MMLTMSAAMPFHVLAALPENAIIVRGFAGNVPYAHSFSPLSSFSAPQELVCDLQEIELSKWQ